MSQLASPAAEKQENVETRQFTNSPDEKVVETRRPSTSSEKKREVMR
jgi:hypothetical protein